MSPIEEYIIDIILHYTIWLLTWVYDNMVVLTTFFYYLTPIVLMEYIVIRLTGKKKTFLQEFGEQLHRHLLAILLCFLCCGLILLFRRS